MKLPKPLKAAVAAAKKAAKLLPAVSVTRRKDGAKRVMFTWKRKF